MNRSCYQHLVFLFSIMVTAGCGIFFHVHCGVAMAQPSQAFSRLFTGDVATLLMQKLLTTTQTPCDDMSLKGVVSATQKHWIRAAGKERWEIENKFADMQQQLNPLLHQAGILDTTHPTQQEYDCVILLGAVLNRVRTRLAYVADLWKKGIRFKKLILLAGERALDSAREPEKEFFTPFTNLITIREGWKAPASLPTNEKDMMLFVYDQTKLPEGLRDIPMEVVYASRQPGERRATTADIAKEWASRNQKPGSILAISNQPYVSYQGATLQNALHSDTGWSLETVGHAANEQDSVAVILDALARTIYQEHQNVKARAHA